MKHKQLLNIGLIVLIISMAAIMTCLKIKLRKTAIERVTNQSQVTYLTNLIKTNLSFGSSELYGTLFSPELNNSITWSEISAEGPLLIYRLPILGCTTCIDETFQIFLNYADSLNLRVKLVTKETELRNIVNFKRLSQFNGEICISNYVIPELDHLSITYAFLFDRNTISTLHLPDLDYPVLILNFLKTSNDRINKEDMIIYVEE